MKLNLCCGPRKLEGFLNLDRPDWYWGQFLPIEGETAEAITISHGLMYAPFSLWPGIFAELARVLVPGGIVRITEDETSLQASERFEGRGQDSEAVSLTTRANVAEFLTRAGLLPLEVDPDTSWFKDRTLIQRWHGDPPKVFFIEGRKRGGGR